MGPVKPLTFEELFTRIPSFCVRGNEPKGSVLKMSWKDGGLRVWKPDRLPVPSIFGCFCWLFLRCGKSMLVWQTPFKRLRKSMATIDTKTLPLYTLTVKKFPLAQGYFWGNVPSHLHFIGFVSANAGFGFPKPV